jgi:acetoin utilization deacetylase AcuC-like enzyme
MTNEELQIAIDKTRAMVMSTEGGYKQDQYREDAYVHLKELCKIQAVRASLASYPTLKAQTALDKKAENARELGLDYD